MGEITIEILSKETLAILEQMEKLKLLRIRHASTSKPEQKHPEKRRWAGSISKEEGAELRRQLAEMRNERLDQPREKQNWAGVISNETAEEILQHLETIRNEWDRDI